MTTKETIISTADQFIRDKGFNAFSFKDIANRIGIKTASIHYHFPTKAELGVATIRNHIERFEAFKNKIADESPSTKLEGFLSIYSKIKCENKVCLVGSLATDLNSVDASIKKELSIFSEIVLGWMTVVLEEGKINNEFEFRVSARTKALMVITNILAIVQLSRLTGDGDFDVVRDTILNELKPHR